MSLYKDWFLASRPWSFSMTFFSISVGAALAENAGGFSWGLYLLTLVGGVLAHAGTNLINDYYDVQSGVDDAEAKTAQYRPHPLVEGKLRAESVRNVALALLGVTLLIALVLSFARGFEILLLGLVGVLISFAYTAPPLKYKYVALGELAVFLIWGPLMVEGAYFVQAQEFAPRPLAVSIPFGVLVALVLLANNIRDMEHDASKGIKTIAIVLGRVPALALYRWLMVAAYVSVALMALFGYVSHWALLTLLSLPIAVGLFREMSGEPPKDADARTAKLDTAFGLLLVLSLAIS
jgi:1,4-dihydroxy-2-naphthoate octaprenyltransferase